MKRLVLVRLDIDPEGGPAVMLAPQRDTVFFRECFIGCKTERNT